MEFQLSSGPKITGKRNFLLTSEPNDSTKPSLCRDQERTNFKKFKLDSPSKKTMGVPWKIKKPPEKIGVTINTSDQSVVEAKLKSFRIYTKEDEIEEGRWGISTKLVLLEDPWKIKKVLTVSDTNGLSRLMISTRLMRTEVLPFMESDMAAKIELGVGARVNVWDYDCGCLYQLTLKRWERNKCFIFNNNWTATIVNGRGLRVGDEIGLFWDRIGSRFGFRVLSWGPRGGSQFQPWLQKMDER